MKRLTMNIMWNALLLVFQGVASLAVVPLLLKGVGERSFGAYTFLLSFITLAQLMQAGIGVAVGRSVAEYSETKVVARLQSSVGFAYAFGVLAGAVVALSLVVVASFPSVWNVSSPTELHQLGLVLAVSLLLNTPLAVGRGALMGLEKFFARNLFEAVPILLSVVGAVAVAAGKLPGGIVGYAAVVEGGRVLAGLLALVLTQRSLPGLRNRPQFVRPETGLMAFQAKQIANQTADVLFYTSDRITLQLVVGSVVVAHYAVADRPNLLAQSILSVPLIAVVPPMVAAIARSDTSKIRRAITAGSAHYCTATLPLLIAIYCFASPLMRVWVGPGFEDSARAARLFIACLIVAAPFKIYSHYRLAEGTIGVISTVKLAYAPVNGVLSYWLAGRFGLIGVVIPTAVFWFTLYPVTWLVSLWRREELRPFCRSLLPTVSATTIVFLLASVAGSASARLPGIEAALAMFAVVVGAYVIFAALDRPLTTAASTRLRATRLQHATVDV